MYYGMDDIGDENIVRIEALNSRDEKWRCLSDIASGFDFEGIQLGHQYQDKFGLSLTDIPDFIRSSFRLTYHLGGITDQLNTDDDEELWQRILSDSLHTARVIGAEDVSVHPPVLADVSLLPLSDGEESSSLSTKAKERLRRLLTEWLPRFQADEITPSLETHVTPSVFAFTGIHDYRDFVLGLPGIGVLIDVSHNHFDNYDSNELISVLHGLPFTGLHLSDSIRGVKLRDGTHLPIGQGQIDFKPLVERFNNDDAVYGVLEVRGPAQGVSKSLRYLRNLS